jgi:ribosome-associated protein
MRLDKITRAAVDALEDVKARDIKVFDVKKMTAMFDKVIVATGDSNRQCRALADRVREKVKAAGGIVNGVEGEESGEWVLVDIVGTVVHIMQPAIRQYYNIEELWAPPPKAAAPRKRAVADPDKPKKPRAPRATKTKTKPQA